MRSSSVGHPKLGSCVSRFFVDFEEAFYLRPLSGVGWLYRVYPEPWQLARQTKEDLTVIETYESRPEFAIAMQRLKQQ